MHLPAGRIKLQKEDRIHNGVHANRGKMSIHQISTVAQKLFSKLVQLIMCQLSLAAACQIDKIDKNRLNDRMRTLIQINEHQDWVE